MQQGGEEKICCQTLDSVQNTSVKREDKTEQKHLLASSQNPTKSGVTAVKKFPDKNPRADVSLDTNSSIYRGQQPGGITDTGMGTRVRPTHFTPE